jgi:hypothetical protein
MALQMNYYHQPFDTMFMNAYWRINPISGIIGGKDRIVYIIQVYKDAGVAHSINGQQMNEYDYSFVPDISLNAPNFIAQAYNHAKTLSMFQGSVDV